MKMISIVKKKLNDTVLCFAAHNIFSVIPNLIVRHIMRCNINKILYHYSYSLEDVYGPKIPSNINLLKCIEISYNYYTIHALILFDGY